MHLPLRAAALRPLVAVLAFAVLAAVAAVAVRGLLSILAVPDSSQRASGPPVLRPVEPERPR